MHQQTVEVYNRSEDSPDKPVIVPGCDEFGVPSVASDEELSIEKALEELPVRGNPSFRRSGLRVWFYCEQGCINSLVVLQHKGNTEMYFEIPSHV